MSATILDGESEVAGAMVRARSCLQVSIVMPCHNEAETLAICVRKALAAIGESHTNEDVIVADNGSTNNGSTDGSLYPGLAASVIGLSLSVWLHPGKRTVGSLDLDVDTLVYSLGFMLLIIHSMIFAACGKTYAMFTGLLPSDPDFQKNFKYFTLERGLIVNGLLLLLGFGSAVLSIVIRFNASLGDLAPLGMLRITVPSITAIVLAEELALFSFVVSLLGTPRRAGSSNI